MSASDLVKSCIDGVFPTLCTMSKYGIDGFIWEILHDNVPISQLDYVEQFEICMHSSYENGYNTTIGGDVNPMKGRKHTEKSRAKISKGLTGKRHSKETLEKKRKAMLGKTPSDEARRKISKNHADVSGENNPMYGINIYDNWKKKFGDKIASEKITKHKQKLSKSIKGKMAGDKNPSSKLTRNIVNEIRYLYENEGYKLGQLSDKYNVSKANICLIVNYKTWCD